MASYAISPVVHAAPEVPGTACEIARNGPSISVAAVSVPAVREPPLLRLAAVIPPDEKDADVRAPPDERLAAVTAPLAVTKPALDSEAAVSAPPVLKLVAVSAPTLADADVNAFAVRLPPITAAVALMVALEVRPAVVTVPTLIAVEVRALAVTVPVTDIELAVRPPAIEAVLLVNAPARVRLIALILLAILSDAAAIAFDTVTLLAKNAPESVADAPVMPPLVDNEVAVRSALIRREPAVMGPLVLREPD